MKRNLLFVIATWCVTVCCYSQIDWKTFMSGQDMIWNRLPQTWYEAPLWETEVWGPTSAKNRKRTQYGWT